MTKVNTLDLIDVCAFEKTLTLRHDDGLVNALRQSTHLLASQVTDFLAGIGFRWWDGTSVFDVWQVKRTCYRLEMAVFMPGHKYNTTKPTTRAWQADRPLCMLARCINTFCFQLTLDQKKFRKFSVEKSSCSLLLSPHILTGFTIEHYHDQLTYTKCFTVLKAVCLLTQNKEDPTKDQLWLKYTLQLIYSEIDQKHFYDQFSYCVCVYIKCGKQIKSIAQTKQTSRYRGCFSLQIFFVIFFCVWLKKAYGMKSPEHNEQWLLFATLS